MSGLVLMTRGLPHHHVGGMESVAWDLARAWATAGRAVTVLTTAVPGRGPAFTAEGVRVRALPGTPPGRYSRAWWRASRTALAEVLAADPGTGVLSVSAAAFACLDLPRPAGTRIVMQAHGTSPMEVGSKLAVASPRSVLSAGRNVRGLLVDARSYRRFDAVVAVGPAVAESLLAPPLGRWVRMPPVLTIPNGVDTSAFRPGPEGARVRRALGVPVGARLLISAGRLHAQKRVDRSLRCLHALTRTRPDLDAHLLVAGEGPEEGRLRALADELGVTDRVRFTGAVVRADLPAHYAAADVSVLTSQWREGLPMAVLEALACGTPAITPLTTAAVEDAGDVVTRVDAGDGAALLRAVTTALERGRSASSLLPARYDLHRAAAQYAALLREGPGR